MWFYVLLQVIGTFTINCIWLVICSTIAKHPQNIRTELLTSLILVSCQFHLDCFQIDWILHNCFVVRYNFFRNWFSKRPWSLLFLQQLKKTLALKVKGELLCFFQLIMIIPCPPTFNNPRNQQRIIFELFLLPLRRNSFKRFLQLFQSFSTVFNLIYW